MLTIIEIHTHNDFERAVLNEAVGIIEKAREEQMNRMFDKGPLMKPAEKPAHPDEETAQVVGSITPEGVTKKAPPAPAAAGIETELAAVVQKALDELGLAATRALVNKHTGEKRWRESDPSVWPLIKAELEQALAAK